jgi:hypothetical protein
MVAKLKTVPSVKTNGIEMANRPKTTLRIDDGSRPDQSWKGNASHDENAKDNRGRSYHCL